MKAVVYGKKGTFPIVTLPVPVPNASQLRVRVHAAALNPIDYKLPSMLPFFLRWRLYGKRSAASALAAVPSLSHPPPSPQAKASASTLPASSMPSAPA